MNWREMEEEREGTVVVIILEREWMNHHCFNNKTNPITNS
jgi:hypothetical protein